MGGNEVNIGNVFICVACKELIHAPTCVCGKTCNSLLELSNESMLQVRRNCLPQVDALLLAGWSFELPELVNRKDGDPERYGTEPWQWYWRAPAKRVGKKGRRYLSTTQAFNAMSKEANV